MLNARRQLPTKSTAFCRALICAILLLPSACNAGQITRSADLDRDGAIEYISITWKKVVDGHPMGGELLVSHSVHGKTKLLWRQPSLNPWKLEIGDVDGDGFKEIVVGVWKKSRYDPVFARRAFVFSWNGRRLLPKWLGSRLSRRFTDFVLCPLDHDGKTELVALEEAPHGAKYIAVYRWRAFGFEWIGRAGPVKGISSLHAKNNAVEAQTKRGYYSLVLVSGHVKLISISEAKSGKSQGK
jgi:hypothetical protein